MSITTLDGALAGVQWPRFFTKGISSLSFVAGRPHSTWQQAGNPGVGFATSGSGQPGDALSSTLAAVDGQIPFSNPAAGNSYLARFQAACTQPGTLILADRLWQNATLSVTTTGTYPTGKQSFSSATFPTRDNAGTSNGAGVLIGMEVTSALGSGTPTLTIDYTNQSGTAGRTATNAFAMSSSSPIGTFIPFGLQAGDTGVRSVEAFHTSATMTSGAISLVAYRPLAALELTGAYVPNALDAITGGFPRLFDGSVPFLIFVPAVATSSLANNISGQVVWTQG